MSEQDKPADAPRDSFGRYLSRQRELRGMTVQAVADFTKLSAGTLKALENDDFARLPERVFLVGAVKAYAKAVGLSVEETVLRLHEALGPIAEDAPAVRKRKNQRGKLIAAGVGAVVLAAAAWFALHHH